MSTALIFPGQGSQAVGMGRDLYASSAAARAVFDAADATLGFALSTVCFEGPADHLTATEQAQPALLTTCVATLAALADDVAPVEYVVRRASCVAGHSLGEYTAVVAAGALDLTTAVRLVRRRGELMAAASEGGMAAVLGMDFEALAAICRRASDEAGLVVVANENAPGQLVISGTAAGLARASADARAAGARRVIPLKVSAAFHSPVMAAAATEMAHLLRDAPIHEPRVPVFANVTGTPLHTADAIRHELIMQVTSPVRWTTMVQQMAGGGVGAFVEIGPGAVLSSLVRRIAPDAVVRDIAGAAAVAEARTATW
ncbi:MAG: ACP S-malonyltransferase [Chloroflexi bacterium]|nr:ACP S-malonyltransferase [Chloroflexota bacterium]